MKNNDNEILNALLDSCLTTLHLLKLHDKDNSLEVNLHPKLFYKLHHYLHTTSNNVDIRLIGYGNIERKFNWYGITFKEDIIYRARKLI